MARVQPENSLVFHDFHQREKRMSRDKRRRVMTEETNGYPGKANNSKNLEIYMYTNIER